MDCYQSGFRAHHSTLTALLDITNNIINTTEEGNVTLLVLLDYSKAFDTINHKLVLAKMKKLGVSESALLWFGNYLCNRFQRVVTDSGESDWNGIINGVPQGSVLGPLLFSIMISDISQCNLAGKYHLYADDTQLSYCASVDSLRTVIPVVNNDLSNIAGYSDKNGLKLNGAKSNYIIIGSRNNIMKVRDLHLPPVLIKDVPINNHNHLKNLGVTFDEVLSWRRHIDLLVGKAYNALRLLYRFKNFLSIESKKLLCNALVLSHFNYCDGLLINIPEQLSFKIQKVQNSCVRYIFGFHKREHRRLSKYLFQLNWLTMSNRRMLHAFTTIHKIINKQCPLYLSRSFNLVSEYHNYNTRQQEHLYVDTRRTALGQKSFMSSAPVMYNNLPDNVKNSTTLKSFKFNCQKHLFSAQTTT